MTEYNFHSTDPDKFNEVNCPVIYTGSSTRVKWYVSDITTNHNIVVLSPDDYIEFDYFDKINIDKYYTAIYDNFMTDFNKLISDLPFYSVSLKRNNRNLYYFEGTSEFMITDISYNLRQVLGLYSEKFPLTAKEDKGVWKYESKGVGFTNFSPVWFLLSNLGQPIQINKEDNPWVPLFPSIVMKIQNSFQPGQPLTYANAEYISISPPAALSNLRVKLVDANLVPIKLLNPLYVSVSVHEITDEEKAPIAEALAQQEANPETQKLIQQVLIKYNDVMFNNNQKVEAGPNVEPLADVMMITNQVQMDNNDLL